MLSQAGNEYQTTSMETPTGSAHGSTIRNPPEEGTSDGRVRQTAQPIPGQLLGTYGTWRSEENRNALAKILIKFRKEPIHMNDLRYVQCGRSFGSLSVDGIELTEDDLSEILMMFERWRNDPNRSKKKYLIEDIIGNARDLRSTRESLGGNEVHRPISPGEGTSDGSVRRSARNMPHGGHRSDVTRRAFGVLLNNYGHEDFRLIDPSVMEREQPRLYGNVILDLEVLSEDEMDEVLSYFYRFMTSKCTGDDEYLIQTLINRVRYLRRARQENVKDSEEKKR